MIRVRQSRDRGHFDHGWLDTRHTFSFGDYYDPEQMGFSVLRVINEDRVMPWEGFGTHPHRDMEIVSYVLEGELQHRDSMGNGSVIVPGDVQRMSAGTGVTHSEFNPSRNFPVHFLQIWILPAEKGIEPGYEQKRFPDNAKRGRLALIASPDGSDGSVKIHQDASIYASLIGVGESVSHGFASGRKGWLQVVRGSLELCGHTMSAGDGAALSDEADVQILARENCEFLLFDLP